MKNILILAIITVGFCLSAAPAHAQFQITIAPGTAGATTIVDNGPLDTDPNPNAIGYNAQIVLGGGAKFIVNIHAVQTIAAGQAEVRIDELTISNNGIPVTSSITVQSSAFAAAPVGPPFFGRAHLDGKYKAFKAGNIQNASVSLNASVLQPAPTVLIGTVTIPNVKNHEPPVAFGPNAPNDLVAAPFGVGPNPDATKLLQIGVTQLGEQLNFTLGVDDRITGPGSALVAGYTADRAFTVNSTADLADGLPGDGFCDTGNAIIGFTGICTLRAALTEADLQPVVTAIQFNIPGSGVPTIQMQSDTTFNFGSMGALQQVIVDGTTQPAGLVQVNGSQASPTDRAGNPVVALDLVGQKSTVLGLVINSFPSHAIQIRPTGAPFGGSNVIEENVIGTDTTGLPLPNKGDGVHISQQPGNSILDNVIANNAGAGVSVDGAAATGNRIHANSINASGGLGISLTNGANNTPSPPVLSSAAEDDSNLAIGGTLHGAPSLTFQFDIFVNGQCNPSGSGEGQTYLGSTSAATDASGDATFMAILPANVSEGLVATATATDPVGNTSEFSACAAVKQVSPTTQPPVANAGPNQRVSAGTLVMLNGAGSSDPNIPPLPLTFQWTQTAGPTVTLTGANTATPSFRPAQAGTYVFSLVVNNAVANSTAASVTITVVTPQPQQLLESLIAQVQSLGLPKFLDERLVSRLRAAEEALDHKNTRRATHQLRAFIDEVKEQSGKKIPDEQADELIAAARQIVESIESKP